MKVESQFMKFLLGDHFRFWEESFWLQHVVVMFCTTFAFIVNINSNGLMGYFCLGFPANTRGRDIEGGGPALYTLHMNELGGRQPQLNLTSK